MEEVSFTQGAAGAASGERAASPAGVRARGNSCWPVRPFGPADRGGLGRAGRPWLTGPAARPAGRAGTGRHNGNARHLDGSGRRYSRAGSAVAVAALADV